MTFLLKTPSLIYIEDLLKNTLKTENFKTIEESILVCSTHEKKSEEFIFNFLSENKLFPLIIISDNSKLDSDYFNFVNNNKRYTTDILTFVDHKNFFFTTIYWSVLFNILAKTAS